MQVPGEDAPVSPARRRRRFLGHGLGNGEGSGGGGVALPQSVGVPRRGDS